MDKITSISEMQKFHFGSKVIYSDGEEGALAYVVFDPSTQRMTSIGVKQGRFFGKTVQLPFDTVIDASSEGVTLRIKRDEVTTDSSANSGGAMLDSKSTVEDAASATKATLLFVAVHPKRGELAYMVVHHLHAGQDTLLRQEFVTALAADNVKVNIPATQLHELPPYYPDNALQREVEQRLYDLTLMHIDLKAMTVRVLDSVLYLNGNISSENRRDIAEDQALGIPGLLEIKNNLIADDRLAGDLAMALGRDHRTSDLPIGVYPRLGEVRLGGAVHTNQQKVAAEEIVRSFAGVRSVSNELVVNPTADMIRVMSPAEGGDAEDKVPGKYVRHTK